MTLWACIYDPHAERWVRYPHRIERIFAVHDGAGGYEEKLVFDQAGTLEEARRFCEAQAAFHAAPENDGAPRQWVVLDETGGVLAEDGDGYTPPLVQDAAPQPRAVADALRERSA